MLRRDSSEAGRRVESRDQASTSSSGPQWISENAIWSKMQGDAEFLAELAELFRENSLSLLDDCRRALAERDAESLSRAAHAYKGMLGNFTDREPLELARRLEAVGDERRWEEAGNLLERCCHRREEVLADLATILGATRQPVAT